MVHVLAKEGDRDKEREKESGESTPWEDSDAAVPSLPISSWDFWVYMHMHPT